LKLKPQKGDTLTMSGYLEFYDLTVICQLCNKTFEALYCEDGDIRDPPETKTFLASGKTLCPYCSSEITEDKIQFKQSTEKQ